MISLRRTRRGVRDRLRSYRVLLDGGEVAQISPGQTFEINVLPGAHTVQLALDQGSSPLASVELSAGNRAAFVCGPTRVPEGEEYRIALENE